MYRLLPLRHPSCRLLPILLPHRCSSGGGTRSRSVRRHFAIRTLPALVPQRGETSRKETTMRNVHARRCHSSDACGRSPGRRRRSGRLGGPGWSPRPQGCSAAPGRDRRLQPQRLHVQRVRRWPLGPRGRPGRLVRRVHRLGEGPDRQLRQHPGSACAPPAAQNVIHPGPLQAAMTTSTTGHLQQRGRAQRLREQGRDHARRPVHPPGLNRLVSGTDDQRGTTRD